MMLIRASRTFAKNHYSILGLSPKASPSDIKNKFHQLAKEFHPDLNPTEAAKVRFAEIKQAYDVLSDQQKRLLYDKGLDPEMGPTSSDDPFAEFAREFYKAGKSRRNAGGVSHDEVHNIQKRVEITFQEAIAGVRVTLEIQRNSLCGVCNGSRCKPGTAPVRCHTCGGSGSTVLRQGPVVLNMPCTNCDQTGTIIKQHCSECAGKGFRMSKDLEDVQIPAGVQHKETIVVKGKGNMGPGNVAADLLVQVVVQPSPFFVRKGNDVQTTCGITISQAVLGAQLEVQTLQGKKKVRVREGTQDGESLKLSGLGVRKGLLSKGDLVVRFKVLIPKSLSPRQRQLFQEIAKQEEKGAGQTGEPEGGYSRFKNMFK